MTKINLIVRILVVGVAMTRAQYLDGTTTNYVPIDLSPYAVHFEKCVSKNDTLNFQDSTGFELPSISDFNSQFSVIFKLCPEDTCRGGETCNITNFGEYVMDLVSYLHATVQYASHNQETICQACGSCTIHRRASQRLLIEGDVAVDCDTCEDECDKILHMEENGYYDATLFIDCQLIFDADDGETRLYAGPTCHADGSKIVIGVFTDENCSNLDPSKDVDDYIVDTNGNAGMLSYHLLRSVVLDTCMPCAGEDAFGNDNRSLAMCQSLHESAAKCEAMHGFGVNSDDGAASGNSSDVLLSQEAPVCTVIQSLLYGAEVTGPSGGTNNGITKSEGTTWGSMQSQASFNGGGGGGGSSTGAGVGFRCITIALTMIVLTISFIIQ